MGIITPSNKNSQDINAQSAEAVTQINGDSNVVIYNHADETLVRSICNKVIEDKMRICTLECRNIAERRFNDMFAPLCSQIFEIENRVNRLTEPANQYALRDALNGYITTGDTEVRDSLIDNMIERLDHQNRDTELMLIDEARAIIPKLSESTLSYLCIRVIASLILPGMGALEYVFKKFDPIVNSLGQLSNLDISYLLQIGCGMQAPIADQRSFAQIMKGTYDLMFRESMPLDKADEVVMRYISPSDPLWRYYRVVDPQNICMPIIACMGNTDEMRFLFPSTQRMNMQLGADKDNSRLKPMIEDLKKLSRPYTDKEVEDYFEKINPNWSKVFDAFALKASQSFTLTPVAIYIASRKLKRTCNFDVPLDVFYP